MAGWLPPVLSIPGLNRAPPLGSPQSTGSGFGWQDNNSSQLFDSGEGKHVLLRYGDTVSLLPEGSRGVMAYAGALDGRPWVQLPPHHPLCCLSSQMLAPTRSLEETGIERERELDGRAGMVGDVHAAPPFHPVSAGILPTLPQIKQPEKAPPPPW